MAKKKAKRPAQRRPEPPGNQGLTKEQWMAALDRFSGSHEQVAIVPAVGVEITARIVIDSATGWQYVDEVVEKCREHGAAEVTNVQVLK